MRVIPKGAKTKLTNNFSSEEIDCHCEYDHCTMTLYNEHDISALQSIRNDVGSAVYITSGYRCQRHNYEVEGSAQSSHHSGQGYDLAIPKMFDAKTFAEVCKRYFGFVILYTADNFVHCDNKIRG